jgi:uncharacterized protein YkwD
MLRLRNKRFLHRRTNITLIGSICLYAGLVGCGPAQAPSPAADFDPGVQELASTAVAVSTATSIPDKTPSPQPVLTRTTTALSEPLIGARPVFTASDTIAPAPEFDPQSTQVLTTTLPVVEPVSPLEPVQDQAMMPDSIELAQSPLPAPTSIVEQTVQAHGPSSPAAPTPARTITSAVTPLAADLMDLRQAMISAINAERRTEGLPPYQVDQTLTSMAQAHADDMAGRGYMDHVTPEGKTYTDRLAEAGIRPQWRGENIGSSVRPAGEAVGETMIGWLNDPPHRDNILHEQHTHIGVGVAQRTEGWYVFVIDLIKK